MINYAAGGFQGRVTLPNRLIEDPEVLFETFALNTLDIAKNRSVHHKNYGVAAVMAVLAADETFKRISGANYTPTPSAYPRTCAEKGMLRASAEGDMFGGTMFLRAPFPKEIVNSREMKTVPPCGSPCRDILALTRSQGDLVVVTFVDESLEPNEAYYLSDLRAFQEGRGDYPTTPEGMTPKELAISGLGQYLPPTCDILEHPMLNKPAVPREPNPVFIVATA